MCDIDLHKIPDFSKELSAKLSINRTPQELPGVIGAAELDREYKFVNPDLYKDWSVDVYSDTGEVSEDSCDTEGAASSKMQIFTYIHTVKRISAGREWVLDTIDDPGLTYKDITAGITKGPALPMGGLSPYLTTPPFIPAVEIPGVTAPKPVRPPSPDDKKPVIDPDGINMSIKFVEYPDGKDAGDTREVCSLTGEPPQQVLGVVVVASYKPKNKTITDSSGSEREVYKKIPEGSELKVRVFVDENSGISLYPGVNASGASGPELVSKQGAPGKNKQISGTYVFAYSVDENSFSGDSEGSKRITAEVGIDLKEDGQIITHTSVQKAADYIDLVCTEEEDLDLSELFDISYSWEELGTGKSISSPREECAEGGLAPSHNQIKLVCKVTNKQKAGETVPEGLQGSVVLNAHNLSIGGPYDGSTMSDKLGPTSLLLPATPGDTVNSEILLKYEHNFGCSGPLSEDESGSIKATGRIYKKKYSFDTAGDASAGSLEASDTLEIECTCRKCSDKFKDSFEGVLTVYEKGTTTPAKTSRVVCGTTPNPKEFDVKIVIKRAEEDEGCELDKTQASAVLKIEGSPGVGVALGESSAFKDTITQAVDIPKPGFQTETTATILYQPPGGIGLTWSGNVKLTLMFTAVASDGSSTVHVLRDTSIRLRCSDNESTADCFAGLSMDIKLSEDDGKPASVRRHVCEGKKVSPNPTNFVIIPEFEFPTSPENCSSTVEGLVSITVTGRGGVEVAPYGVDGDYQTVYSIERQSRLVDAIQEHIAYQTDFSEGTKKSGSIHISVEASGTYVDPEGEQQKWRKTADKTVKIVCDSDGVGDDEENKANCGVLEGLIEGDGISITPCVDGKRTISATGSGISCSSLEKILTGGDGIAVSSCSADGKLTISATATAPNVDCSAIKNILNAGTGISIGACANGKLTVSVNTTTLNSLIDERLSAWIASEPAALTALIDKRLRAWLDSNTTECS